MPFKDLGRRRAAGREGNRRYRARLAALVAQGDPRAAEIIERRRAKDRERLVLRRDEINARARQRYAGDPEPKRTAYLRSYARNKHRWYESKKHKRATNRDQWLAKSRDYNRARYQRNPETVLVYARAWRRRNPERARLYVRLAHNRRRAEIGTDRISSAEWLALVAFYGACCAYCWSSERIEMDHRIPLIRGGRHVIDNVLPACRRCNRSKRTKTEDEFRIYRAQRGLVTRPKLSEWAAAESAMDTAS